MLLEDQRIALLKYIGYEESNLLYFYDNYNDIREAEEFVGLHLKENLELRVKWVNTLRDVVGRSCPKNKSGNALVSDVDLLFASPQQRLETLLKILKLWIK